VVAEFAALPGVASVQPRAQVSFGFETPDGSAEALLYATTERPALAPPVVASVRRRLFPLHGREIVVPARSQGVDFHRYLGRTITVDLTRKTGPGTGTGASAKVTVAGLIDPGWQLDNPDAAYASRATVVRWAALRAGVKPRAYLNSVGYDQLTVVARTSAQVPAVRRAIQRYGYPATTLEQQLSALPTTLALIHTAGQALLAILALLAFAGTVTVTGALARQRSPEIGVLKALGFRTRYVLGLLLAEMTLTGAAAAVAGTLLGVVLGSAGTAALRTSPDLRPYLPSGVLLPPGGVVALLCCVTVGVVALGALLPARRASRMPPADAMREW
jgi:putative ABC transport system permease protein